MTDVMPPSAPSRPVDLRPHLAAQTYDHTVFNRMMDRSGGSTRACGRWRPVVAQVLDSFLACGVPESRIVASVTGA